MSLQAEHLSLELFDEVTIPIWVESGQKTKTMLAVCSNVAPNQKVPEISVQLAKTLGWTLHMVYVVDIQDTVFVDERGKRSNKKTEAQLLVKAHHFKTRMEKKGIQVQVVKGILEKETIRVAERLGASLVILGRERKKKRAVGWFAKSLKRRLAEKCRYSILYIN
jgi:nucleotide-binding universal stress UspA family protein